MNRVISYFFLLWVLVGCSRPTQQLQQAEACMQGRPDSALKILKGIPASQLHRKADQALYALLFTQAQHRNYIPFSSDSLINIATNYYDESEPRRAGYAWFYKSRYAKEVESSSKLAPIICESQKYAEQSSDHNLLGLVYFEKGDLYKVQNNYDSALFYFYKSNLQFGLCHKIVSQCADLCAISDIYRKRKQYDSVFSILKKMESLKVDKRADLYFGSVYLQCASILVDKGNYTLAKRYLNQVPQKVIEVYNTDMNQIFCNMYIQQAKYDSAKIYLNRIKTNERDSTSTYYQLKMRIYESESNWKDALSASKQIVVLNDSIDKKIFDASFAGLEKKYNYQSLKLKNQHLILRNKRYTIILLGLILAFLGCFTLFLWWRNRARKNIIDSQKSELETKQKLLLQESDNRALVEMQLEKEKQLLEQQLINNQLIETQLRVQKVLFEKMEQYKKHVHKPKNDQHPCVTPVYNSVFFQELIVYIDIEYDNFSHRLKNKSPEISEKNVLICCLAMAGFDTGMTAAVMDIQQDSLVKSRHRIRKLLRVENGVNFEDFLRNI